jgi:alkanesulfonate monooxygenase SsuD/methylene tetrahydromethanopterin reductase-like flavin-dependent oxidoreductase (luciferase family)
MTRGIGLSPLSRTMSVKEMAVMAAFADVSGYSSVWAPEGTGRTRTAQQSGADAFSLLTVWAMQTTRIELATGIVAIYTRSPMATAMHAATLSELAPGRIVLGIGSGHANSAREAFGFHTPLSLSTVADYGAILRGLLDGQSVTHSGEAFSTSEAFLGTEGIGKARVVLAALGPKMSELAGRHFDGVLWNWLTPDSMTQRSASLRNQVPSSCQDFRMSTNVRVAVGERTSDARKALASELLRYCLVPDYRRHFHRQGLGDLVEIVDQALTRKGGGQEVAIHLLEKRNELDLLGIADTPRNARAKLRQMQAETDIELVVRPVGGMDGHNIWPVVTAMAPSAPG